MSRLAAMQNNPAWMSSQTGAKRVCGNMHRDDSLWRVRQLFA